MTARGIVKVRYVLMCYVEGTWREVGEAHSEGRSPTIADAMQAVEHWLAADPVNKTLQWHIDKVETRSVPVREYPGHAGIMGDRHYFRFSPAPDAHRCSVAGCMASRENAIHIIDGSPAYYAALRDTPVLDALSE